MGPDDADSQVRAEVTADPLIGAKLGEYLVEAVVAAGGMGVVYRARHPMLGHRVAVKVLRPEYARSPKQVERFLKEAQVISAMRHRGVVEVFDFAALPDGRQYMVLEFLEGETLAELLKRGGALAPARALGLLDEMLDALAAVHGAGVVHRDLKPSNVFIAVQTNGSRYVKLVDFGISKPWDTSEVPAFPTASLAAGTPEFLSPEQAQGIAATPQSDLYSLGVMMFEMLTGQLPFAAATVSELVAAHLYRKAPRVGERVQGVPPRLEDLIARLLEKKPGARPASAGEVRTELTKIRRELKHASTQVLGREAVEALNPPASAPAPQRATPFVAERKTLWKTGVDRRLAFGGLAAVGVLGFVATLVVATRASSVPPPASRVEVVTVLEPLPVEKTPGPDTTEIDAKLAELARREREPVPRRDFKQDFRNLDLQAGVRAADEKKKTDEIGQLFANEVSERDAILEARSRDRTGEQRARDEIRNAKVKKDCAPNWKKGATAQIDKAFDDRRRNLDPDDPVAPETLKNLQTDTRDLRDLVKNAKTTEDCLAALDLVEKWAPPLNPHVKLLQIDKISSTTQTDEERRFLQNLEQGMTWEQRQRQRADAAAQTTLTAEQRAREEIRAAKTTRPCPSNWKATANAKIQKALRDNPTHLEPAQLKGDARDLTALVKQAKTDAECRQALDTIEQWTQRK